MTQAERVFWQRVQRRVAMLTPDMAAALLFAFAALRDRLDEAELARLIALGYADRIFTQLLTDVALTVAFQRVREEMRRGVATSFRYQAPSIPAPPPVRSLTIGFDVLNPRVVEAVRTLETRVITTLQTNVRDVVRAVVAQGLRDGLGPKAIAATIRSVVGLAPNQEQWVDGYRLAAENAHLTKDALTYQLRDHRFDTNVLQARASGEPIAHGTVDRMVDAMRRRTIAFNTETVARTAVLDAQKLGQRLAWEAAADQGIVDRARIRKTWVGVMDAKERPAHVRMEQETVGFDETFSNGQMIPGDDEYNCRCLTRYWLAAA